RHRQLPAAGTSPDSPASWGMVTADDLRLSAHAPAEADAYSILAPWFRYNALMSTRVTDYKAALDHLPAGGTLVLPDISWGEYEELLKELDDRPSFRVTYNEGRLQIMSPQPKHEEFKRFIERIIDTTSDELDINV